MADPTPKVNPNTVESQVPPPWDGSVKTEQYCALCGGYVNGNGCDRNPCPVRPK